MPRKVNIQYLQADEEKYRSAVTEAEITARYEKDPKSYDRDIEEFEEEEDEKDERARLEREDAAERRLRKRKRKRRLKPTRSLESWQEIRDRKEARD